MRTDWLSATRTAQLTMAKNWVTPLKTKASGWNVPANASGDRHSSFFTKRKKDLIEFAFEDSGKTAWFAVQVENNGKKGPWGRWCRR